MTSEKYELNEVQTVTYKHRLRPRLWAISREGKRVEVQADPKGDVRYTVAFRMTYKNGDRCFCLDGTELHVCDSCGTITRSGEADCRVCGARLDDREVLWMRAMVAHACVQQILRASPEATEAEVLERANWCDPTYARDAYKMLHERTAPKLTLVRT